MGDMNDKESEDSPEQQINKKILDMERKCHEEIIEEEKTMDRETQSKDSIESKIIK